MRPPGSATYGCEPQDKYLAKHLNLDQNNLHAFVRR